MARGSVMHESRLTAGRVLLVFGWMDAVDLGKFKWLHTMGFVLALVLNFYVNMSVARFFETNKDAMNLVRTINDIAQFMR